jgi:hypothetical protein
MKHKLKLKAYEINLSLVMKDTRIVNYIVLVKLEVRQNLSY